MPNILCRKTAHCDKDPFADSDRASDSGKGDSPRNLSQKFRDNYDSIEWGRPRDKRRQAGSLSACCRLFSEGNTKAR
jgi:hypothetical protein